MKKISSSICTIIIFLQLFSSCFLFVQNASAIELNNQYPVFPGGIDINKSENQQLNSIVAWLYYAIIGISGFTTLIMIIWGGVQWLTSTGNPSAIGDAQDRIKSALLGLLIIFASFIIIQTINPDLTILKLPNP